METDKILELISDGHVEILADSSQMSEFAKRAHFED